MNAVVFGLESTSARTSGSVHHTTSVAAATIPAATSATRPATRQPRRGRTGRPPLPLRLLPLRLVLRRPLPLPEPTLPGQVGDAQRDAMDVGVEAVAGERDVSRLAAEEAAH